LEGVFWAQKPYNLFRILIKEVLKMVECKSASTMVKPTDVCQQMREDKTSAAHKDRENEQNSVLNSLKEFFADLIAFARAYDHRNESVLLIGGGYPIVLPPKRIDRPPV
jgi:hypothetical protein